MKTCLTCNLEKPLSEFHKKGSAKDGLNSYCKPCAIIKAKASYRSLDSKNRTVQQGKETVVLLRDIVNRIKIEHGCCFCVGIDYPAICLDFHHLDPTIKEDEISRLIVRKNRKKIIEELTKCVVVCSNCHRKIHAGLISPNTDKVVVIKPEIVNELLSRKTRIATTRRPKKVYRCIVCNVPVKVTSRFCDDCRTQHAKCHQDKIAWPNKEELHKLVWSMPTVLVCKELGVSDHSIAKRCAKYGIERPPNGYWQRRENKQ